MRLLLLFCHHLNKYYDFKYEFIPKSDDCDIFTLVHSVELEGIGSEKSLKVQAVGFIGLGSSMLPVEVG